VGVIPNKNALFWLLKRKMIICALNVYVKVSKDKKDKKFVLNNSKNLKCTKSNKIILYLNSPTKHILT
jgi:hypothetical protein